MPELVAVVLAAGHGTRMKSALPKVLHPACGRPLVYYPVRAALELGASRVVVVVNNATKEAIEQELARHVSTDKFSIAIQETPQGTGDAARAGVEGLGLSDDDQVIILYGDVPLLTVNELRPLLDGLVGAKALSFMTFTADDPTGYGRILRDDSGSPIEVREEKDLENEEQRAVKEGNAGVYAAQFGPLSRALAGLDSNNAQGEYYLTDIVKGLAGSHEMVTVEASLDVLAGVNDRSQLSEVEQILFARIRQRLGKSGVSIVGKPMIDDTVEVAPDARIEDGVRLRGRTSIGAKTLVDVGSVVQDTTVGENANIKPYCALTESTVGNGVQLGPFAHLRPNSVLEDDCHIGNFVETKKSVIRRGAKANHLSYLGDTEVGEKSNIGAGVIVCNYNGFQKQRTTIGRGVFVGSDSQLVAPVNVGDRAYVATNTTVTEDVPDGALAIGRSRQTNKEGYGDSLREKFAAAKAAEAKK